MVIPHPEYIAISGSTVIVTSASDEMYSILEPLLIVSIDYPEGAPDAAAGANQEGSNP
jgi:hypothetical protein